VCPAGVKRALVWLAAFDDIDSTLRLAP